MCELGQVSRAGWYRADKPRVWSERRIGDTSLNGANSDVAPDGKLIAALMTTEGSEAHNAQTRLILMMNFFDEVRRRVPSGK